MSKDSIPRLSTIPPPSGSCGVIPIKGPITRALTYVLSATDGDMQSSAEAAPSSETTSDAIAAADSGRSPVNSINPKDAYGDKKPDLSLIPPPALLAEAKVMQLGANKYGAYNWREKTVRARVYTAAAMRHILAWQDGVDIDEESGESHLAHARACLGILIDAFARNKIDDDRKP